MPVFAAIRAEVTVAVVEAEDRQSAMFLARHLDDSEFEIDEELGSMNIEYLEE